MGIGLVLWFDVEKKTITTRVLSNIICKWLWFDVEKKTITTNQLCQLRHRSCGLM